MSNELQQIRKRVSDKPLGRWVSASQLAIHYGVSQRTIWRWAQPKNGRLPQPHKILGDRTRWDFEEVQALEKSEEASA